MGAIAHFGSLCRAVEELQADSSPDDGFDDTFDAATRSDADTGFDDSLAERSRCRQEHFERLLGLASRLDLRDDGSGHALRRSLCISLQQQPDRVCAARSLLASVADRPAAERVDLHRLIEHLLIVGFGDSVPMKTVQCRSIHAMLAAAACRR